ncbi:hypothetical protein [Pseudoramibacter alactolyticus]|uniref:hypothetical protein n=1 Tax=Pseudoramibacter alactolyticus TaxID=113287 RepID=UPI0028EE3AB5|nr:hypothetical protein [Pseudoramibacter alactolyticus]
MTQAIMPCFDKNCGNYDEAYSNHCRALNARARKECADPEACFARMSWAAADAADDRALALADGETYRRLAEGIARRKNPARSQRITWPLPPGRGGLKLGHGERR